MEREININYIVAEIIRRWKGLLIAGIIGAVVMAGLGWMQMREAIQNTEYGTVCTLKIITANNTGLDYTTENKALLTGERMLERLRKADGIKGAGLSAKEIQEAIHLSASQNGNLIELDIITGEQALSNRLCRKIIQYTPAVLKPYDKTMEIIQGAMDQGPVSVTSWENPSDPRISSDIIRQTAVPHIRLVGLIKRGIMGGIVGILLVGAVIGIRFVYRQDIRYAEQIEDRTGIPLLGTIPANRGSGKKRQGGALGDAIESIYSNMLLRNREITSINLLSPGQADGRNREVSRELAAFSARRGERTLLVQVKENGQPKGERSDGESYDQVTINKGMAARKTEIANILAKAEQTYERIFLSTEGSHMLPAAKRMSLYTEGTMLLIKTGMVKGEELIRLAEQLKAAEVEMIGAVFDERSAKTAGGSLPGSRKSRRT